MNRDVIMYHNLLSKKAGLIFLIIMTLICSSNFVSCSSRLVVVPDNPGEYQDPADYSDLDLVISRFDVVYIDKSADREDVVKLRKEFMSYLAAQNYFSSVTDSETSDTAINRYLNLEVEITPEYTTNRTWILDVMTFYPFLGLWPITPHWGEANNR